MSFSSITIQWPNGSISKAKPGDDWLALANAAGCCIPTGCLGGSCGACEIDVNGETIRACISSVKKSRIALKVELASDPYW
jgi:ferredoxin